MPQNAALPSLEDTIAMQPHAVLVAGFETAGFPQDELNDWYDTEHIPERMAVRGFLNADRWVAPDGTPVTLATYDLDSVSVLDDPMYTVRKGAGRTPWSRRIARGTRLFLRLVARQTHPGRALAPPGAGGLLLVLDDGDRPQPDALAALPGCVAARRFICTEGATGVLTLYHLTEPSAAGTHAWHAAEAAVHPHPSQRLLLARYHRTRPD